jgi:excisionase family DNA binding protein
MMGVSEVPVLLRPHEVAARLGVSPGTLAIWRCTGRYRLPFVKVGRLVLYRPEDLEAFIQRRLVSANHAGGDKEVGS